MRSEQSGFFFYIWGRMDGEAGDASKGGICTESHFEVPLTYAHAYLARVGGFFQTERDVTFSHCLMGPTTCRDHLSVTQNIRQTQSISIIALFYVYV